MQEQDTTIARTAAEATTDGLPENGGGGGDRGTAIPDAAIPTAAPAADPRTTAEAKAEALRAAPSRYSAFYALHFREFRLFFIGQFISVIGTWMQTVAEQWLVFTVTGSGTWLGIVAGASAIPYAIFAVWGGHVADRYPRRTTLLITQFAAMVLAFALAIVATGKVVTPQGWHIALLAALLGIVNAFNMPAQQAFVVDIVEERDALPNAIALNSVRFNVARFIGPVFAGWALVKVGAAACFFLNALSFVAVIISLWMTRPRPAAAPPDGGRLQVSEGIRYIVRTRPILRIVILLGFASLFTWSTSTVFPLIAHRFNAGAGGFSAMMAVQGVGAATAGLILALFGQRIPRRLAIYGGVALQSISLILLAFSGSYWLILLWLAVNGFALIMFAISANTKVQEEAPDSLRGRVMAAYSLVQGTMNPAGSFLIGPVAEHVGVNAAVGGFAAVCLAACAAIWGWSTTDRRETSAGSPS